MSDGVDLEPPEDPELASQPSISLRHAQTYLLQHGWQPLRADALRLTYASPSEHLRAFLPTAIRSDHDSRVADLIRAVAEEERRSLEDVTLDLAWAGFDKLSVRTRLHDRTSAIPMQVALDTHEAVRNLLVAAARAANDPQPRYSRGWPTAVATFVDQVRWVPAVAGSYVVRALLPMRDETMALPLEDLPEPSLRKVTSTLIGAVGATREVLGAIADRADALEDLEDLVPEGVSANLLDALAQLAGPPEMPAAFEVGVNWTYAAPEAAREPVRFERSHVIWLGVAADRLRGGPETLTLTARGLVTRLRRDTATGPGRMVLEGFIDGTDPPLRRLEMELPEPDYKNAVSAHRQGATVLLRCTATRQQGTVKAKTLIEFSIEPE